jgi:hypothetical protein
MATIVHVEVRRLPKPILISQNVANRGARVTNPHPAISIFNFHYASPPDTVAWNYHLNKVIGENETGFRGTDDEPYRTEAWDFVLAGGGLYNNLDYSFTVGHEDGTFRFPPSQPGGGGPMLRRQLRQLGDFISGFDVVRMRPEPFIIRGGVPANGAARVLGESGKAYAVYLSRPSRPLWARWTASPPLEIELPSGTWKAEWTDPVTGRRAQDELFQHQGGTRRLAQPSWQHDVALKITRQ